MTDTENPINGQSQYGHFAYSTVLLAPLPSGLEMINYLC